MCRRYHVETVPCTNRTHLVVPSGRAVRDASESQFAGFKETHAHMILGERAQSVRVNRIAQRIVGAVHRGLGDKAKEPLDWACRLNWEVVVVDHRSANGMCFRGAGKIVIHTGLLRRLHSDAEIASVLAHEVGHVIARHSSEIMSVFVERYYKWRLFPTVLAAPFSRRLELEADYIGIMLLAASGFHPFAALRALEKGASGETTRKSIFNKMFPFLSLSTHPSWKERSRFLLRRKVMEEAIGLYKQVTREAKIL